MYTDLRKFYNKRNDIILVLWELSTKSYLEIYKKFNETRIRGKAHFKEK